MEAATSLNKLIHIARRQGKNGITHYLFLRQVQPRLLIWHEQVDANKPKELETEVSGETVGEAMRNARKQWKNDAFRTVICGFRYTLPERDEHGCNALFHQMVASYNTPNGVYFDEEVGHNCIVNFASQEARDLWKILQKEKRL